MTIPNNNDIKPKGGQSSKPTKEWGSTAIQNWSHDGEQPYYARSSLTKLVLPAMLYSLVFNTSLKMLSFVPFTSRLRIGVEKLNPKDCFAPKLPPADGIGDDESSHSIAIVTGSNTGVGFETASSLAERGYHVILACRSRDKGEAAMKRINDRLQSITEYGDGDGTSPQHYFVRGGRASFLHPLDLSSFASVRSFCRAYSQKYKSLNLLVNNAGINSQGDTTVDGLEICFQSNFVGHFLLTKLLLGHLLRAKNRYQTGSGYEEESGRIVNLSSVTHHFSPSNERTYISTDDQSKELPPNSTIHNQHFWLGSATPGISSNTYRESKLASILFSMELNKRFGGKGIRSIAVDPGSVSSDIWRNDSELMQKAYKMVYLTQKQGCSTSLAGAIGALPKDALYLQPYWQPEFRRRKQKKSHPSNPSFRYWYSLPFPMTEMLGPYVGHAITEPRLPVDGCGGFKSSEDLWNVCEKITSANK